MRKILFLNLILACCCFGVSGQYVIKDGSELLSLQQLPQEKAYVDHTGPLVFSGEYLYYAFYCFNAQNNNPTNISRVGYVVLVNEEKEKIFEHKLNLDKGLAQGDFFVRTDIPSGRYKLLAYTQWMRNGGLDQVYTDDIVVINPYLTDQSAILTDPSEETNTANLKTENFPAGLMDSATVSVRLEKEIYGTREKVRLSVNNYKGPSGYGIYTLKVKRKEEIPVRPYLNATQYAKDFFNADKQIKQKVGDSIFLPEQRGELFYGAVYDSSTDKPVKDIPVIISIPGKEFILKFAQTDTQGNFYTYLNKEYKNTLALAQIEEENKMYSIKKGAVADLDLYNIDFSKFTLSDSYAPYIKERSVLNQLENQFFTAKPDSIIASDPIDPFDGGLPEEVFLDEFTRFPTFGETLVEVVKFAGYRSGGKDPDYIKISQDFETYNEEFNSFPAIVLIDGVFIPNHENIKSFDARKIEKISLVRDQFVLGGKQYQGMMTIETFEGDYLEEHTYGNSVAIPLKLPVAKKNYFKQDYDDEVMDFSRIPDYRGLLLWEPHVKVEASNYNFEFFTSDVEGIFEVILNGFTTYGKPITVVKEITVIKPNQ
ncbi:hypothetical protein DZC72_13605 [Maribacter algicola]|uniref:Carboxypeptidase regulatory-like domain-containing protein n=1 Tax=Maribacter algicola TaxID=2498892 RepID=A0A3R8PXN6_9FLAO|nr:hypothetical protein [Maribacter algicola]RRQ48710.1 hypothetical protein DZC72_13605 [Maribacter algicola]